MTRICQPSCESRNRPFFFSARFLLAAGKSVLPCEPRQPLQRPQRTAATRSLHRSHPRALAPFARRAAAAPTTTSRALPRSRRRRPAFASSMARGGGARAAMQARKAKQEAAAAAAPEKKKKPKKKERGLERRPSRMSLEEGDGPVTCAAFLHACPVVVGVWGLGHISACRGVGLRRDMRWV